MSNSSNTPGADEPAPKAPEPGSTNTIVDVPGIRVGQYQQAGGGYLTGTTVVHPSQPAVAGVNVAGGAPGTRETDLLDPRNLAQRVHAVVLSGGSSYGLISAYGVMQWLRERRQGFAVGTQPDEVVPIVPGAVIFDLGRGGKFTATPSMDFGYKAMDSATDESVAQGTVGAGTGARSGTLKGGLGTASVVLPSGYTVGALVAVNSLGNTVDPATGRFHVEDMGIGDEFGLRGNVEHTSNGPAPEQPQGFPEQAQKRMNTTIAAVATDAPLTKAMANRLALRAQDGLAMAIRPVHTLYDGDTVFALSTGDEEPLSPETDSEALTRVFSAGADTLARAVVHAIRHAESAGELTAYSAAYPDACA